jgi:5'-3' exoribonuclease 2
MLSLATHEPHFSILRETVTFNKSRNCFRCGQSGHLAAECTGNTLLFHLKLLGEQKQAQAEKTTFQLLHVNILREYLNHYLYVENLAFEYDLERVIDDWVFLCFFIGNDFLPHLPTLEIREGAIGLLTDLYKKVLPTNGYLTKDGELYPERVEVLLVEVGQLEHSILVNRLQKEKQMKQRRMSQRAEQQQQQANASEKDNFKKNMEAAAALKASLMSRQNSSTDESRPTKKVKTSSDSLNTSTELNTSVGSLNTSAELNTSVGKEEEEEPVDEVRLGEEGWRERYYEKKFGVKMDDESFFKR